MAYRDGLIWFDGELVPWREAQVHVLTHTLHYGLGVFEGVRAYHTENRGTCIFRLQEHTDRLFRSAHILGMDMPFSRVELNAAQRRVEILPADRHVHAQHDLNAAERRGVLETNLQDAYLRPIALYDYE